MVITAVYMLRFVRGAFFGELKPVYAHVHDAVSPFARLPYVLLMLVLLGVGCWPAPLVRLVDSGTRPLIERVAPEEVGRLAERPIR